MLDAFIGWCCVEGKTWEGLDEAASAPFVVEFAGLATLLALAREKGWGIIW